MNCQKAIQFLEDYLDNVLDDETRDGFQAHLETCPACRNRLERAQALKEALRTLSTPGPDPDFSTRVFARASAARSRRGASGMSIAVRIAASILVVVALGYILKMNWRPGQADMPEAFLSLNRQEEISLVFYSEKSLNDVTLSLEPPAGVDVVGFEDRRAIVWQVDLKQGENLLVLPVIAHDRQGGSLVATIRHGSRDKQFRLRLNVTPPETRGEDAENLETRTMPALLV